MFLKSENNRAVNLGTNAVKKLYQLANTANESLISNLDISKPGSFIVGRVVRSGVGLYDVEITSSRINNAVCVIPCTAISSYSGVSECNIPFPGSKVLIYVPNQAVPFGIIITFLPENIKAGTVYDNIDTTNILKDLIDPESGSSLFTEFSYLNIAENKKYFNKTDASTGRPFDLMPGNLGWINDQGISLMLLNLLLILKASEQAKLELGVLDDMVRLTSGYFRHIHSQGEDQIYNDGGFITRVIKGTLYQCERLGFLKYNDLLTKKIDEPSPKKAAMGLVEQDLDCRARFQIFLGHLGDLLNFYISAPDVNVTKFKRSKKTKEQGLLHAHFDTSGRVIVRTATGISLQRSDRIAIPQQLYEPWDPEGVKLDDDNGDQLLQEKKPFIIPDNFRYGRHLMLRDMMAWYNKLAVQRISEVANNESKSDYYLPEEKELSKLNEQYDTIGKGSEEFNKYSAKESYFNLEPDGSFIIRDAWGSEIIMRGGNIIISCAGQIELRSGKNIINLAGHDVVVKAKKSIDLTATDKDVRIKANVNLHMLAEGREHGGGVLIESKAKNFNNVFDQKTGEAVISSGIILKAADTGVFISGKKLHLNAVKAINIETFSPDNNERTGDIFVSAKGIYAVASKQLTFTVNDKAGLLVSKRTAVLAGKNTYVIADTALSIFRGSRMWVPLTEARTERVPYNTIHERLSNVNDLLSTLDWLAPFAPSEVSKITFTYRSAEEYGTVGPVEVDAKNITQFFIYEPAWTYLARSKSDFINVELTKWIEYPINDTYPWPGKINYENKCYIQLEQESNIEDPSIGLPKIRKQLVNKPGNFKIVGFNEYEIIK